MSAKTVFVTGLVWLKIIKFSTAIVNVPTLIKKTFHKDNNIFTSLQSNPQDCQLCAANNVEVD